MKSLLLVFALSALICGSLAQFKTRQMPEKVQQAENLEWNQQNNHEQYNYNQQQQYEQNGYDRYNGKFIPAEYYQGETILPAPAVKAPLVLDPTAEFINKTRAGIAPGFCYTEVPTHSLAKNGQVPISNGTTPGMSKVEICCEGYERNPHIYRRCDPVCADDCPNGICTAPNTCVCIPGHIRNEFGKCVTTCPIGCDNGICTSSGECQCRPGYTLEPRERKFCVAQCEPPCRFGKCVEPNKCACAPGYQMNATGVCEAHCDNCENGTCTGPGMCTCKLGYTRIRGTCEPVCALGCDRGFCIAPDTCSCPQGSALDRSGTKCIPNCGGSCLNGICTGDNQCDCEAGYILDEQQHMCVPYCAQGCPNGFCSAPNFCSCNPGFIKTGIKGRTSCMPSN